jgi:hypothetical protein
MGPERLFFYALRTAAPVALYSLGAATTLTINLPSVSVTNRTVAQVLYVRPAARTHQCDALCNTTQHPAGRGCCAKRSVLSTKDAHPLQEARKAVTARTTAVNSPVAFDMDGDPPTRLDGSPFLYVSRNALAAHFKLVLRSNLLQSNVRRFGSRWL